MVLLGGGAARRSGGRGGLSDVADAVEPLEVARPFLLEAGAELAQVLPRVEPGVVAVVEHEAHRVLADGLDPHHRDVLLGDLQHVLAGAVALHLGGRGVGPQVLEAEGVAGAVGERHLDDAGPAPQPDLGRWAVARWRQV
jgi:hypothetical protein